MSAPSSPTTISRDELRAALDRHDPIVVLEALPLPYFRKHHLPGARNLPPDQVAELAPQLIPSKDTEVVLYCWDPG